MKRYAFIYNPAARGGKSESKLKALEQHIEQLPKAELFRSEFKGDISGLIGRIKDDFDIFVACGGDGTIREIASQLISTDKTMGIIPMGTGNDLCKTLNIPNKLRKSQSILFKGKSKKIDVGRCNDYIFLNALGFGFDGLTNRYAFELKNLPSFLRYVIAALKATVSHSPFRIHIKKTDESYYQKAIMATLANGRVEGSTFWIAPQASLTDGKLNLITITPIARWLIPFLLPLIVMKKPGLIPQLKSTEVEEVELQFRDEIEIHADGEVVDTKENKFSISLIPNGLEVISG